LLDLSLRLPLLEAIDDHAHPYYRATVPQDACSRAELPCPAMKRSALVVALLVAVAACGGQAETGAGCADAGLPVCTVDIVFSDAHPDRIPTSIALTARSRSTSLRAIAVEGADSRWGDELPQWC
jgi:hypothetical protein